MIKKTVQYRTSVFFTIFLFQVKNNNNKLADLHAIYCAFLLGICFRYSDSVDYFRVLTNTFLFIH